MRDDYVLASPLCTHLLSVISLVFPFLALAPLSYAMLRGRVLGTIDQGYNEKFCGHRLQQHAHLGPAA